MKINHTEVETNIQMDEKEIQAYITRAEENEKRPLEKITINVDGEFVELGYVFEKVPFVRIRRITGYLVGSMDNWNDSKTAEEKERVKHKVAEMEKI